MLLNGLSNAPLGSRSRSADAAAVPLYNSDVASFSSDASRALAYPAPKLQDDVSHDEKRRLLESIILWKLRTVDGRVMDAVRRLSADPNQSTEELAACYRVTSRHLLRLFETHVGYGPKALARIFRLQRTLSIAGSSRLVFSDLALAAGYSDQSHMYREFSALCSELPSDVVRRRGSTLAMSDLFKIAGHPVG